MSAIEQKKEWLRRNGFFTAVSAIEAVQKLEQENEHLRTQLTEAKAEVERAHAAIKLYRDGVDSIYNHSKGGRMLVIKFFGTLHPVIRPTHPDKPEGT